MHTIMIVEDELLEQQFLKEIITEEMQTTDNIITCTSGIQSIQLTQDYCPDIIFMDILLPELNGIEALQQIKKMQPNSSVVILSGCPDFSYAQKAIHLNVQEYLLKPIRPTEIRQAFHRILNNHFKSEITFSPNTKKLGSMKFKDPAHVDIIEKSLQYIHKNFKKKLSLKDVSTYVYMNPQYFSRIFKKNVGICCIDYINNLKINYACNLLNTTDESICNISFACGFSDQSYFNRVFINQINITPMEFRRNCKSIQSRI